LSVVSKINPAFILIPFEPLTLHLGFPNLIRKPMLETVAGFGDVRLDFIFTKHTEGDGESKDNEDDDWEYLVHDSGFLVLIVVSLTPPQRTTNRLSS